MRPVQTIDPEFFAPDEALQEHLPLLDQWFTWRGPGRPLTGVTVLLIQHQLSNQVPMLRALLELGLAPQNLWWLDIPYTSHAAVRDYAATRMAVPTAQMWASDYPVLAPYAPYQHARTVAMLNQIVATKPRELLVLDDGAYVLEALATLAPSRWPAKIVVVEQTTRGFIKMEHSAALRAVARQIPIIDVAKSAPKRQLEPPFIAMAVCAALQPHLQAHFDGRAPRRVLILGYGAIGEQVASFVRGHFGLGADYVAVFDPSADAQRLAQRRGFVRWNREDYGTFQLVIGCSGNASFGVGDHVYLDDGALLASASSGSVELSRQGFIELADSSADDDLWIDRTALNERNVHADLKIHLVSREATFVNAGFPVNFNGRLTVCPTRFIQPTPTMMVEAAVQAIAALRAGYKDVLELGNGFPDWVDREFRQLLGERVSWLSPPPDSSW